MEFQFIAVKSEIGAGTSGSSLGFDAVMIEAITQQFPRLDLFKAMVLEGNNQAKLNPTDHPSAKYIDQALEMCETICNAVSIKIKEPAFPIVFSGDHSNAAGTISGIKTAFPEKRLGAIWIDAHADLHSPYTSPSGNVHGMPLAICGAKDNQENQKNDPAEETVRAWNGLKAIGTGNQKIELEDVVFIGLRQCEAPEWALIKKHNIQHFNTDELNNKGVKDITSKTLKHLEHCDLIYVSFDVDSLDPSVSRGTGTPVDGGLSIDQAKEIISILIQHEKVKCLEITEINPLLDTKNKMAKVVLEILTRFLA